jgi:hypothetical protein
MSRYKDPKTGLNNIDEILETSRAPQKEPELDNGGEDYSQIMDRAYNGMGRSELYRAQVSPELFPHERAMRVENWSEEDREMFCGGIYTKGYK